MADRKSEFEIAFMQGYVCAVAEIIRTHDQGVVAKDVLRGILPVDWRRIDEYDRASIRASGILGEIRREKTRRRK